MAATLSFKDINMTFKNHPITGDLVVSKDGSAIKQAIVNLLLTNKGEKLYNPEYGSDIRNFLFEPMDYATSAQIKQNIMYTLGQWEPRIEIEEVKVATNYDENGFDVSLVYTIRGLDNPPTAVDFFLSRTR